MTEFLADRFRWLALFALFGLAYVLTALFSDAPLRVDLHAYLVGFPLGLFGAAICLARRWGVERRSLYLVVYTLVAAFANLAISSRVIYKIEMTVMYYVVEVIGFLIFIPATAGVVALLELIVQRLARGPRNGAV